jgi:hypothetical protein
MAGNTHRTPFFNLAKVADLRRMGGMTVCTVIQTEMRIITAVMTGRTFRNNGYSFRRMGLMAIKTTDVIFMGRFLPGNSPDFLKVTFETVILSQRQPLDRGHGNRSKSAA